jgi:hypothetical protein
MSAGDLHAGDPRFFGLYIGCVHDNEDPLGLGRVRPIVPAINGNVPMDWAFPLGTVGGGALDRGIFSVPEKNSMIGVFPDAGDETALYYITGWWPLTQVGDLSTVPKYGPDAPADAGKKKRVIWETRHWRITISDEASGEFIRFQSKTISDLFIHIENNTGEITLSTASGKDVLVGDATASQLAVLGGLFQTLFNAHTHGGVTAGGSSTGPPTPQMTAAQLSSKVKIAT